MISSTHTSSINASLVPRHAELLASLEQKGHLTISELTSSLKVSEQTIRRDLKKLEDQGLLIRFHGGASSLSSASSTRPQILVNKNIELREVSMVQEKEQIAQKVAALIPDGSTVFITIGTTVERIAAALATKNALLVITNSLRVAGLLYRNRNIKVIVPSGQLSPSNGGIEGSQTINDLGNFRADFFITSVGAIASDGTLLDFNISEVEAAKVMQRNATCSIIACDHSKFTAAASVKLANLNEMDYLVTDKIPNEELRHMVHNAGVKVIETTTLA